MRSHLTMFSPTRNATARTASPRAVAAAAWLTVALALVALLAYAMPAAWTGRLGINHFQDDAFYYLVPAKHFLAEGRFSFDGIDATNGFHPLWMAVVVALLAVLGQGASPEHQVLGVKLLELGALAGAVALCSVRVLRAVGAERPEAGGYLAVIVALLCPWYVVFEQGMETTLAALLLLAVVTAFLAGRGRSLALLLVLLFLCRLDTGPFIAVPLALVHFAASRGTPTARLAPLAASVAAILLVTLVNVVTTGHAVPISGAIKSSFPRPTPHLGYLVEPFNIARLAGWRAWFTDLNLVLCAGLLLVGAALAALLPERGQRVRVLALAFVGLLLLANLVLFQQWEKSIDPRYLALPLVLGAFVLGTGIAAALRSVGGHRSRLAWIVLLGVPLAAEAGARVEAYPATMAQRDDPTRAIFAAIANVLPADAVIAGTDVGALAFWTGRRVINLDGVMNTWHYQDVLRDRGLADYLRERGVGYIATALWDRPQTYTARPTEPMYRHQIDPAAMHGTGYACHAFYVYSYVHHAYSDSLCLRPEREVFRTDVGRDGVAQAAYVVYRLSP